jgi:hypothetical protein
VTARPRRRGGTDSRQLAEQLLTGLADERSASAEAPVNLQLAPHVISALFETLLRSPVGVRLQPGTTPAAIAPAPVNVVAAEVKPRRTGSISPRVRKAVRRYLHRNPTHGEGRVNRYLDSLGMSAVRRDDVRLEISACKAARAARQAAARCLRFRYGVPLRGQVHLSNDRNVAEKHARIS